MQKGDTVRIYQKPITQEDFEGLATLISEYRPDIGDGLSMWVVHFANDYPDETYVRTIYHRES